MPMLAVTRHSWPMTLTDFIAAARSLRATEATSSWLFTSCSITTNSSPPRRATTSLERRQALKRTLISWSSLSPASCPSVSFTNLKRSRSMNITAKLRL